MATEEQPPGRGSDERSSHRQRTNSGGWRETAPECVFKSRTKGQTVSTVGAFVCSLSVVCASTRHPLIYSGVRFFSERNGNGQPSPGLRLRSCVSDQAVTSGPRRPTSERHTGTLRQRWDGAGTPDAAAPAPRDLGRETRAVGPPSQPSRGSALGTPGRGPRRPPPWVPWSLRARPRSHPCLGPSLREQAQHLHVSILQCVRCDGLLRPVRIFLSLSSPELGPISPPKFPVALVLSREQTEVEPVDSPEPVGDEDARVQGTGPQTHPTDRPGKPRRGPAWHPVFPAYHRHS